MGKRLAMVVLMMGVTCTEQALCASDREVALAYFDTAEVIDVVPMVSLERVSTPYEECRVEPVRARHVSRLDRLEERDRFRGEAQDQKNGSLNGLLGALVGGAIGNQFGDGNGRKAMTVLGALAGAGIATSRPRQRQYHRDGYSDSGARFDQRHSNATRYGNTHCRTLQRITEQERIEGYRVTYRYLGQEFEKITDEDPGNTIRVRVEMSPVLEG